jgi:hypothetical protein
MLCASAPERPLRRTVQVEVALTVLFCQGPTRPLQIIFPLSSESRPQGVVGATLRLQRRFLRPLFRSFVGKAEYKRERVRRLYAGVPTRAAARPLTWQVWCAHNTTYTHKPQRAPARSIAPRKTGTSNEHQRGQRENVRKECVSPYHSAPNTDLCLWGCAFPARQSRAGRIRDGLGQRSDAVYVRWRTDINDGEA